ncbi:hypothetical protein BMS93_08745 [Leuconostoc pseudomesenteroides]|uniref:MobV family relaxase n=1 Tax=Leuconostoc falkenbergense TaxID=2766470 RepID=UPI000A05797A|nr:hypothetical protein BMS86_08940 [Leuconostoc pseudomesenteroides]ORI53921.1 hypothetical protein BMS87_08930 [Leuconostoc pseudomesenteroides]ORI74422.1 hypothetical protein BMS89_09000 [Leuconostoc pseudomesenteroides]ORI80718.1 hypothetical protein BMS93_08745 [Leuconostoc pseudomesenteroides]
MSSTISWHIEKHASGDVGGLQIHNQRLTDHHSNKRIDVSKSHENLQAQSIKQKFGEMSYSERINQEIKNRYLGKRKIRANAIVDVEHTVQFGGDQFETLSRDQKNDLMMSATKFVADKFGGWQNVLDWNAHLDETKDHAHMDMIPLTEDGRLSAKDLYSKGTLQIVQNELLAHMQDLYPEMDFKRADNAERGFANGKTQKDYERLKTLSDANKEDLEQANAFKKEMITLLAEVNPDETVSEKLQKQKFGQALSDNKVTDFWKKYGTEVAPIKTNYGFNQFFDWLNLSEISQRIRSDFKRTKDWISDRREGIKSEKQEMATRETEIKYSTEQLANVLDLLHPAETEKIKQLRHGNGLSGLAINGKSLTNAEALPYVLREATIKRLKELEKSPLLNSSYRIDQNRGPGR